MVRNKISKHSILEAQRAQSAISRENYIAPNTAAGSVTHFKGPIFELPVASIKKDLVKDFVFAAVSIALLVYLKDSRLGFAQLGTLIGG